MSRYQFTSESVTEGHPDKICDQISDAVLDAYLAKDAKARVACETLVKTGFVVVAGEITSSAAVEVAPIVREVIKDIGYTSSDHGFDAASCGILVAVERQSPDIAQGVTEGQGLHKEQGAGDQGLMFGYACDETKELMPLPIMLAHKLTRRLAEVRKKGELDWLRPDGKSQVTVEYDGATPKRIEAIVVSTQHGPDVKHKALVDAVMDAVIKPVLPADMLDKATKYHVNPTGRFVVGGPMGDAGLTGRKIIVDSYGGMGRHGGGAFSGKDPSKVDRSACYYARYVAKTVVAAKLAKRCEVQVAYAIGVARPVGVYVNTFGTGVVEDTRIADAVSKIFDFRPKALIEELDLMRPIYRKTAAYGHFGRHEKTFTWERTDRADELAAAVNGTKKPAAPKANGHTAKGKANGHPAKATSGKKAGKASEAASA